MILREPLQSLSGVLHGRWDEPGHGGFALVDFREGFERLLRRRRGFRVGHRRRLEATDLVVFATARAASPLRLVLAHR